MRIQQKLGHLSTFPQSNRTIDRLELEWFETSKRILRKKTAAGKEVIFSSLNNDPQLTQDDVLYADEQLIIAIEIRYCNAIVVKPTSMFEMAAISYEIGNNHLPLFYDNDELLVPFDLPLFRQLTSRGFAVKKEQRKLLQQFRSNVASHAHKNMDTLFTKIMKLTTNE